MAQIKPNFLPHINWAWQNSNMLYRFSLRGIRLPRAKREDSWENCDMHCYTVSILKVTHFRNCQNSYFKCQY